MIKETESEHGNDDEFEESSRVGLDSEQYCTSSVDFIVQL